MITEPVLAAPEVSVVLRRPLAGAAAASGYWALTKPEVNFLIAVTTAAGFCLASPGALSQGLWLRLLHTLLGTLLVASGAATLNQWMEHPFDAAMRRTARRPIVEGRVQPVRALAFGASLSLAGLAELAVAAGILASLLAAATLAGYLLLYTPSKRRTILCTLIGAFPGAVPPLIGWASARGRLDPEAWVLYAVVLLWQFPHVMAIAWMYQDDYDRAGFLVLPRGRARAGFATSQTLLPILALLPLSLVSAGSGTPGAIDRAGALLLGVGFLLCGARFARLRSGPAARRLLMASIFYLPSLLVLRVLTRG
jgi:heme o synthase